MTSTHGQETFVRNCLERVCQIRHSRICALTLSVSTQSATCEVGRKEKLQLLATVWLTFDYRDGNFPLNRHYPRTHHDKQDTDRLPIPGRTKKQIHHSISYADNDDWLKLSRFFQDPIAFIAVGMDSIKEGERALLDNSMLTLCLSMMRGHRNANELPVVMLGHAGWPDSNRPES